MMLKSTFRKSFVNFLPLFSTQKNNKYGKKSKFFQEPVKQWETYFVTNKNE